MGGTVDWREHRNVVDTNIEPLCLQSDVGTLISTASCNLISIARHGNTITCSQDVRSESELEYVVIVHETNDLGDVSFSSEVISPVITSLSKDQVI